MAIHPFMFIICLQHWKVLQAKFENFDQLQTTWLSSTLFILMYTIDPLGSSEHIAVICE